MFAPQKYEKYFPTLNTIKDVEYSVLNLLYILTLIDKMVTLQVLVVIDAKPKDLGLPTEAYIAVEEVHDVSLVQYYVQSR